MTEAVKITPLVVLTPSGVEMKELQDSIVQYKQQHGTITGQLAQLEVNYAQNKAIAVKTLDMLSGAVQALETLVQSINDRKAAAEKAAADAAALEPANVTDPLATA